MSGHIRKSRFNTGRKEAISSFKQKEISEYATHGKLKLFLLEGRGLTTHTHTNPKEKKKGTSLSCRPGRPVVRAVSRQNGARFAAAHTPSSNSSSHKALRTTPSSHAFSPDSLSASRPNTRFPHERLAACPLSSAYRPLLSRPTPFWACLRPLGQSGKPTRLLLINVTGGGVPTAVLADSLGLQTDSLFTTPALLSRAPWCFGGKIAPRPCRTSIPLLSEIVSTRCRRLWCVVKEVAL